MSLDRYQSAIVTSASRGMWFVPELPLSGINKIDRTTLIERAALSYKRHGRQV